VQARGGISYTPGLGRYTTDNEPTQKDDSTDTGCKGISETNMEDDGYSLNYARKAIREMTAIGRLRLEERKSNGTAEDNVVQVSDVSSSTAESESASETPRGSNDTDSASKNEKSTSASVSSRDAMTSSDGNGPAADDTTSVEVAAEKQHVGSASDVDGLAACLT